MQHHKKNSEIKELIFNVEKETINSEQIVKKLNLSGIPTLIIFVDYFLEGVVPECTIMNRLNFINSNIDYRWLNKYIDSFKIHCKFDILGLKGPIT